MMQNERAVKAKQSDPSPISVVMINYVFTEVYIIQLITYTLTHVTYGVHTYRSEFHISIMIIRINIIIYQLHSYDISKRDSGPGAEHDARLALGSCGSQRLLGGGGALSEWPASIKQTWRNKSYSKSRGG